ncbi:MAG: DUF5522 domain-containing protein [Ferruginibacter sp.]
MTKEQMPEDEFYYNSDGFIVLTEKYLLERGYCCGNGCLHCPYLYKNVPEPKRNSLLKSKKNVPGESGDQT